MRLPTNKKSSGEKILITGASSGIGEAMAYEAAKKGYALILSSRREAELERVAKVCRTFTDQPVWVFPMDVSSFEDIEKTVAAIQGTAGMPDILINNAGIGLTEYFLESDINQTEMLFRVNVLGAFYLTQLIAIHMAEKERGHIFFTASMAGKVASPKTSLYAASKAAVIAFCDVLRMELHSLNIPVTTINPGPVDTPFFERFDPERTYLNKIKWALTDVDKLAEKTIRSINSNKRAINTPWFLEAGYRIHQLFPSAGDALIRHVLNLK